MNIRPFTSRHSVATDIARQLHDLILSGELRPGDRLPGQRELAARFGASMTCVREAISALASAGLVDVRPGRGTIVQGLGSARPQFDGWLGPASEEEDLLELLEARRLVESYIVQRVARLASPQQKTRLRELLADMKKAVQDPEAYLAADIAFHQALADMAGNRVLARMMRAIRAPMRRQLYESNLRHMVRRGDMMESYITHEQLVEGVERGDSNHAVKCINEMVDRAGRLLQEWAQEGK